MATTLRYSFIITKTKGGGWVVFCFRGPGARRSLGDKQFGILAGKEFSCVYQFGTYWFMISIKIRIRNLEIRIFQRVIYSSNGAYYPNE